MFRLIRESSRDVTLCTVDRSTANVKIGRDPKTCIVHLGTKAVAVSREHAELQWSSNGVTIVDTSSFGTLVDGVKILKSSKLLKGGEKLKIGNEEFIIEKVEEAWKMPSSSANKPAAKNTITSFFTKKNDMLRERSQPAEIPITKILATETPYGSQESLFIQPKKKSVRGARRVNPLFDCNEEDEGVLESAIGRVLALETPSDSIPSERVVAPIEKESAAVSPPPISTQVPVEKKKKVSLFAKPSQRARTQKPAVIDDDDDIMMLDTTDSSTNRAANSLMEDGFARPNLPRTRSRTATKPQMEATSSRGSTVNRSRLGNYSDDIMEMNASSIPTQVVSPVSKSFAHRDKDVKGFVSEPPKKKPKSIFEEHYKKQKKLDMSKPREPSLLDEDDNGVLNIRYDYVPPKPVIGERAYSSIENLRIMEQMGRDAKARLEKKYGLDKSDEMESQYPSVEELTSILCSSHTEEKKDDEEKEGKEVKEVERVGDETLDEEIKSQLVTFCDNLIVSQPSDESMASINYSQGRGFKKFKKARQGRFATQSTVFSGIIGGSDLVDFRQIQF